MDSLLSGVVSNTAFAGVLALVAFGVHRIGRSPQLAHALWLLVLIKLVTPPVYVISFPDRLLQWGDRAAELRSPVNIDDVRSFDVAQPGLPVMTSSPRPIQSGGNASSAIDESTVDAKAVSAEIVFAPQLHSSNFSSVTTFLASRWQIIFCVIWIGGVIAAVAILCRQLSLFRTLLMEATDCDARLIRDAHAFATQLGVRNCPPIRILDARIPPLVFAGWRRQIVLIPARLLDELDREQLHTVLVHELAHIRRRDHLTRWFESVVRGIFWWHPLAWWAARQLRQAEEECCDAWVIWALPNAQRSYGKALLWTTEFLTESHGVPAVAGTTFGGSHVKRRIEMIVNRKLNRKMSWGAFLVLTLFAAFVLPLAAEPRAQSATGDQSVGEAVPRTDIAAPPSQEDKNRDLATRIAQLEQQVKQLTQMVNNSPVIDPSRKTKVPAAAMPKVTEVQMLPVKFGNHSLSTFTHHDQDQMLRKTLLARDKQAWDAAANRDWKAYEKLLRTGYYWGYFGWGRDSKAANVAALKRRRYFDATIRAVEVGKISNDVAFLSYVYDCKVEEGGWVETYRDHRSMQIWTQIDGEWYITYIQDSILNGGE